MEDYKQAVCWLSKSAEQGNDNAQLVLGQCYYSGLGVSANKEEAFKYYSKSAGQGNLQAITALGLCYKYGDGVEKDGKQPIKGEKTGTSGAFWA